MTRWEAFELIRRARNEFDAARFALTHVSSELNRSPELYRKAERAKVTVSELKRCSNNIQITFIIRLFSEFEAILRDYWLEGMQRVSEPNMQRLMDWIASQCNMDAPDLAIAHQMRDYRNKVIHNKPGALIFDLPATSKGLGMYLRWLPEEG